jgi:hypothetical protein
MVQRFVHDWFLSLRASSEQKALISPCVDVWFPPFQGMFFNVVFSIISGCIVEWIDEHWGNWDLEATNTSLLVKLASFTTSYLRRKNIEVSLR